MIIIDPGHGYNTPGKISPVMHDGSQLSEWKYTRLIARGLHKMLTMIGIPSIILVTEAIDVSLPIRCERANRIYDENPGAFLISIHGNAGGGTGWEAYTYIGESDSDKIATYLYHAAEKCLPQFRIRTDYVDGDPDKEAKFYILKNTKCPAVLTENLFYDTEKDYIFMKSESGIETLVRLHVMGIIQYLIHK